MNIKLLCISILIVPFLLVNCSKQNYVKENYSLQVGSSEVLINGKEYQLNAPIVEINGCAYLPLRFFAERFNVENLQYDTKTEKITFSLIRYVTQNAKEIKKHLPK
jgi:hypothetical protein